MGNGLVTTGQKKSDMWYDQKNKFCNSDYDVVDRQSFNLKISVNDCTVIYEKDALFYQHHYRVIIINSLLV